MIVVRYAICSDRQKKPLTRAVCDSRAEAEKVLESVRRQDSSEPADSYWIAELGPECEAWRYLVGGREAVT